ncbi:MAG TPA: D-alanyl-D-alanine carboxypeptidase/D-alanyl-D-alanine-endopeptidase [Pyrinomonadaceae bacterium]
MTKRRSIIALTLAAVAVVFCLAGAKSFSNAKQTPSNTSSPSKLTTERETSGLDPTLSRDIEDVIAQSDSAQARWGVFVVSMKDGRVLVSNNGDKLFTPASNMKIYTTAVALDLLGADYRWRTSLYALKQPDANGVIDGDLILYGRGAPDLDSKKKEGLAALVDQLYVRGVRRVRGNIVGDKSYFRSEMHGDGWQWNDLQWYYGAEPSALSIDENSVEVTMGPANKISASASVVVNPNDSYFALTNSAKTGEREAPTTIGINRGLSNNDVHVWGEFPIGSRAFSAFLSVHNPALHAATIFKQLLKARGIQVDGDVRGRDFRVAESEKFDPRNAVELAFIESASLADLVRKTNKESNNLYAELILRTLGKERGATAPDSDPRKNASRGDDVAGTAVVTKWLNDHGIGTSALAIHDGSGLSRLDLVTPESTARLLAIAAQTGWSKTFQDSLPIAGRDGTLEGRLNNVAGRIIAKTGSLTYDHSLSGYVTTTSGEILAFSIICNDATGRTHPIRAIDEIGSRIAASIP